MGMCPLAADWGNVADWAAVVIGLGAVVATTVVAVLAQRTSKRATEIAEKAADIAEEATRIAAQQHQEFLSTKDANGQIVGRILVHEVSQLPVELYALRERCKRIIDRGEPRKEVAQVENLLKSCSKPLLRGTEQSEDRLHTLPDAIRNDLAVLIGYSRSLNSMSSDLMELIKIVTYTDRFPAQEKVFGGSLEQMKILQEYVEKFSRYSLDVVNELRVYIGAERVDLSKFNVDQAAD